MRVKSIFYGIMIFILVLAVSGCGTVPKKFKEEVSGIKSRVETLESRVEGVETKQSDVERLTSEQMQAIDDLKRAKAKAAYTNISAKPKTSPKTKEGMKMIQTCLKNAGFYKGKIDGIKGRGTRRAIKDFQKSNGLAADGKVGPKTWELLSKYSSGPVRGAAGAEEAK